MSNFADIQFFASMPSFEDEGERQFCTYAMSCDPSATNYRSEQLMSTQKFLTEKLTDLLAQFTAEEVLDLIKRICQLKIESNETGDAIHVLQKQLQMLIEQDEDDGHERKHSMASQMEFERQTSMENDIDRLRKDIDGVESILADIDDYTQQTAAAAVQQDDPSTVSLQENPEEELNDSDLPRKITQKIQLSNNIVRWLRGPVKMVFNGTLYVFDVMAQGTHISHSAIQAVKHGCELSLNSNKHSYKSAFTQITSDWIFINANPDQGFNSPSVWMHDPQGRRILVKTQSHPLCAVNEWLAYVLGKQLDLPVNEVQISLYENNLVTLHTDVARVNEKTVTFMELRKQTRKNLLTDPLMGCMDLFDHIIQNVDRNQRNILITMPQTCKSIDDDQNQMKIHLIDHASCFGMGKLSVISLIACKFHTNHLSIVKFDPNEEARKFQRYLNRLPIHDRKLFGKTLQRFASIANEQFDSWINEVRDLLSSSQATRIRDVLIRQRDIAKRYSTQWTISQVKSSESKCVTHPSTVTYF